MIDPFINHRELLVAGGASFSNPGNDTVWHEVNAKMVHHPVLNQSFILITHVDVMNKVEGQHFYRCDTVELVLLSHIRV